jgi:hypothetical protein
MSDSAKKAQASFQSMEERSEENLRLTREYVQQTQAERDARYNQSWKQICCTCAEGTLDDNEEEEASPYRPA